MWMSVLLVALSIAVVGLTLWTVHRARLERRRSEARVAALASAIDKQDWTLGVEPTEPLEETPPSSHTTLLAAPQVTQSSRRPAFAIAAVVVIVAGTLLLVGMNGGGRTVPHTRTIPSSAIELVSMRHVLDGETLIVSGLVRNSTAAATPALTAVVSVLGRDGRVVARGESLLDPVVLGPGKETNFRVSISEVGDPGRYRVAFRNGSQIVPHVDRRTDLTRAALANDAHGN